MAYYNYKTPQIALIMGSKSDADIVKKAADMFDKLEIGYTKHIYSAHRTPDQLKEFIKNNVNCGTYEVVIAFAGMAAALAGVIAAETMKPVIGVPLSGGKYKGIEALLATIEMPPGIPVLTVGIDAAKNAALAAARIIALNDEGISKKMKEFMEEQSEKVKSDNESIEKEIW